MEQQARCARYRFMREDRPSRVFEQPLRVSLIGSAVVVRGPRGEVFALSALAAKQSSENLSQACDDLRDKLSVNQAVVNACFWQPESFSLGSTMQTARLGFVRFKHRASNSLALLVAAMIFPGVAGTLITASLCVLTWLLLPHTALQLLPWILAGSVITAIPLALILAPLLLDREERRTPFPNRPLSLVSTNIS